MTLVFEKILVTHTCVAGFFEHPHSDARHADTGLATTDTGRAPETLKLWSDRVSMF